MEWIFARNCEGTEQLWNIMKIELVSGGYGGMEKKGKIFFIMGKSATGKDTIYQSLLTQQTLSLKCVVPYTTRPIRSGELDGETYHFITEEQVREMMDKDQVIESRCYQTVYGLWYYLTADDGQIDLTEGNYLMIGTLESYGNMLQRFGQEVMVPIYLWLPDGLRLERALERERQQEQPKFAEMCRRYLADEEDFSKEKLQACGITEEDRYENENLEQCIREICEKITKMTMQGETEE